MECCSEDFPKSRKSLLQRPPEPLKFEEFYPESECDNGFKYPPIMPALSDSDDLYSVCLPVTFDDGESSRRFSESKGDNREHELRVTFVKHEGFISKGGDLHLEVMTIEEAKRKAMNLKGCSGFCFSGEERAGPMKIFFKSKWDCHGNGWTAYRRKMIWVKGQVSELELEQKVRAARQGSRLLKMGLAGTPSEVSTAPSTNRSSLYSSETLNRPALRRAIRPAEGADRNWSLALPTD